MRRLARWYAHNCRELALLMWVELAGIFCVATGWLLALLVP